MIQVSMTLFEGRAQGQIYQQLVKIKTICHISDPISPTDFILGIKVQPIKAHSMTLMEGQGINFQKM